MAYDPKAVESTVYDRWEKSGYFNPDKLPGRRRKIFSIAMPPPNVTGDLHIGHALTIALEDLMIRYHRMKGEATLWVPGTDHAGIATQIMVERMLAEQGTSRHEIGREEFLEHVWQWKERHGSRIVEQIKAMGASCDWSREHFTMDRDLTAAVHEAFVRLFNDGLIYRSTRLINWCPNDRTALSDLEVKHEERAGSLWFIRYRVQNSGHALTVATTRPETLLGDTAVAVNPKDERYRALVGRRALVPIVNREVPIIADQRVEREFGTGAVKVTPAHDFLDAEIAKTHNLPALTVIGPDARMTREAGQDFEGMPIHEARTLIVEALNRDGLLDKTDDYRSAVTVCDRCGTTIEPQLSKQWFVKMQPLARRAIAAVRSGKITVLPERFKKQYFRWMENIQDWCISRQLWWGHRIPVWYCLNCDRPIAGAAKPTKRCPSCRRSGFRRDEDVLDTWFSSGLWTFSTLGWPRNQRGAKRGDLRRFHPTSVMETGWDILTFWVSRMVALSLYLVGEIPFRTVYLNGLILDIRGKKMSKSKGTGIDPSVMTARYGTDALRLSLTIGQSAGQDFRMYEGKIAGARNFVNKLWNIGQYVRGVGHGARGIGEKTNSPLRPTPYALRPRSLADRWILSRLSAVTKTSTAAIDRYDFSSAGQALVDFAWHEFADWYVEIHKSERNDTVLARVYETALKLLHPFAPFITEALWRERSRDLLMITPWPKAGARDVRSERAFADLQRTVVSLRNFKKYSGLTAEEPGTIRANGSKLPIPIIERLAGVRLSGRLPGERVTLNTLTVEFPPHRVPAFQSWQTKRKKELTDYIALLEEKLKNRMLPDDVRTASSTKLAAARRELNEL